ncbi:MAG: polyprenyl synthetase family protein [Fibrobacterota bacterium]
MRLYELYDLFHEELASVALESRRILSTGDAGFTEVIDRLLAARGKGVRPLVLLLFSRRKGGMHPDAPCYAACVELLHTASLLQDDFLDNAALRRNRLPLYREIGNRSAVLAADFVSVRVFSEIETQENARILRTFLQFTAAMVEGEIAQSLAHARGQVPTREQYFGFIEKKTASLFMAAARTGGVLSRFSDDEIAHADRFGRVFGTAFQILDDITDLDDRSGLCTLPIIHHLENGGEAEAVQSMLQEGDMAALKTRLLKTGSIRFSAGYAEKKLEEAHALAESLLPRTDAFYLKAIGDELMMNIKQGASYAF